LYKIMIVEDEDIIREGIRAIINRLGNDFCVISECENGQIAWESFQKKQPDIVITDIRMRRMDGLELIEKLRLINKDIYIIIISGYSEFEYAQKALKYKVYEYILKPIDAGAFINTLIKIKGIIDEKREGNKSEITYSNQIIKEIMTYVSDHLTEDISLNTIALKMELTPNYLSTLFKSETGMNFTTFVADTRINKAKNLLLQSHLKIYEISDSCGYSNPKHFDLCFKKLVGMTPQQYRNSTCL